MVVIPLSLRASRMAAVRSLMKGSATVLITITAPPLGSSFAFLALRIAEATS